MSELWAITVALSHEANGLLPAMKWSSHTRYGHVHVYEGLWGHHECLLVQTGMGPKNAEKATRFLLKNFSITHLISTGYCGGLKPGLNNSDILIASSVLGREQGPPLCPNAELLAWVEDRLKQSKIEYQSGPMVTSGQAILKSSEKTQIHQETGAWAVDMESYSVLKVAGEDEKIASLALRFVVDALQDDLTDTSSFVDDQAGFKMKPFMGEVVRRPKILLELPGLERQARRARKTMTRTFQKIFQP